MAIRSYLYGNPGQRLLQVEQSGDAYAIQNDSSFSTSRLIDDSGAIAGQWSFDSTGNELSSSGSAETPWLYGGDGGLYTQGDGEWPMTGPDGVWGRSGIFWDPVSGILIIGGTHIVGIFDIQDLINLFQPKPIFIISPGIGPTPVPPRRIGPPKETPPAATIPPPISGGPIGGGTEPDGSAVHPNPCCKTPDPGISGFKATYLEISVPLGTMPITIGL